MATYKEIEVEYKGRIFRCEGLYEIGELPIWKPTFEIESIYSNYTRGNVIDFIADLGHLDELTELCLEVLRDE